MQKRMTERDLVEQFKVAKQAKADAKTALENATLEFDKAEAAVLELLEANGAETTARYEGLGYVRQLDPKLYASYTKDNEETVFAFVKEKGRDDLIKPTINAATLSTFVKELIELGQAIPEGVITYYFKKKAQLYGAK